MVDVYPGTSEPGVLVVDDYPGFFFLLWWWMFLLVKVVYIFFLDVYFGEV